MMRTLVVFPVLLGVLATVLGKESPPIVQVYGRYPGQIGEQNNLICHVSGFHPPDISIQLLRNGVEIPEAKQTDLAFDQGWQFHLTKTVAFTPQEDEVYACKVTHMKKSLIYSWDHDM